MKYLMFGYGERDLQKDRDGYDAGYAETGVYVVLYEDGSINAYETPDLYAHEADLPEPNLSGTWERADGGVRLELKRHSDPESRSMPLPAGDFYWYPINVDKQFSEGSFTLTHGEWGSLMLGGLTLGRMDGDLEL